mmetsp:Transcript_14447/g.21290  ORF Transcript_14447/g.21290 Transcript_14447/m.21290 type:complete len:278 (+) Transcript_14447:112-945(+)
MGKEESLLGTGKEAQHVKHERIQVIAPADLQQGYQFEAEAKGRKFTVVVPPGGVKEGQQFTVKSPVILPPSNHGIKGSWKNGLFACFKHGCCHPHLCLSCCCGPLALAQVMTRMRLTWTGDRGSIPQVANTFQRVARIFFLFVLAIVALDVASFMLYPQFSEMRDITEDQVIDFNDYFSQQNIWDTAPTGAIALYYSKCLLEILFCFYIVLTTCKTRRAVREQYEIPNSCCGCEDFCCSLWCGCCTTMQMMRHTADYDQHEGKCCTKSGLPPHCDVV